MLPRIKIKTANDTIKEGLIEAYYASGSIWMEENYKKGIKDGKLTWYYGNGQIEREGFYSEGK